MRSIKRKQGFTLIEILIAMVIMAFGLLGLAGLQASGLKQNQSAYLRSQATALAYDLADRVRANRSQIATYIAASSGTGTQATNCLNTTGCSALLMAAHDIYEWKLMIGSPPLNGTGSLTQASGAGTSTTSDDVYTITINWDDDRDGDIDTNDANFTVSFGL